MKKLLLVPATVALLAFSSPVAFAGEFNSSDVPTPPSPSSTTTTTTSGGHVQPSSPQSSATTTSGGHVQPSPPPPSATTTSTSSGSETPAAATVIVTGSGFSPQHITVPAGSAVVWINQDSNFHTVTSTISSGPQSNRMFPGKSFRFTFTRPGTFTYFCTFHPAEVGSVTVTGDASNPATSSTAPPSTTTKRTTTTTTNDGNAGAGNGSGASASSSSATATANTFVSVDNSPHAATGKPTSPPAAKQQPAELPATGVSDTVILFGAAAAMGVIFYNIYSYVRRKLIGNR